jgi:hypothetical protein
MQGAPSGAGAVVGIYEGVGRLAEPIGRPGRETRRRANISGRTQMQNNSTPMPRQVKAVGKIPNPVRGPRRAFGRTPKAIGRPRKAGGHPPGSLGNRKAQCARGSQASGSPQALSRKANRLGHPEGWGLSQRMIGEVCFTDGEGNWSRRAGPPAPWGKVAPGRSASLASWGCSAWLNQLSTDRLAIYRPPCQDIFSGNP